MKIKAYITKRNYFDSWFSFLTPALGAKGGK